MGPEDGKAGREGDGRNSAGDLTSVAFFFLIIIDIKIEYDQGHVVLPLSPWPSRRGMGVGAERSCLGGGPALIRLSKSKSDRAGPEFGFAPLLGLFLILRT